MTEDIITTVVEADTITLPQLCKFLIQPRQNDWCTAFGTVELRVESAVSSGVSE